MAGIVFVLRAYGINTTCSCAHEGYIQCDDFTTYGDEVAIDHAMTSAHCLPYTVNWYKYRSEHVAPAMSHLEIASPALKLLKPRHEPESDEKAKKSWGKFERSLTPDERFVLRKLREHEEGLYSYQFAKILKQPMSWVSSLFMTLQGKIPQYVPDPSLIFTWQMALGEFRYFPGPTLLAHPPVRPR